MDIIKIDGVAYLLTVASDITDRKKFEEELTLAKEEAEAARMRQDETLADLERFNHLMMNREERVLSLKHEVNILLAEQGRNKRYEVSLHPEAPEEIYGPSA